MSGARAGDPVAGMGPSAARPPASNACPVPAAPATLCSPASRLSSASAASLASSCSSMTGSIRWHPATTPSHLTRWALCSPSPAAHGAGPYSPGFPGAPSPMGTHPLPPAGAVLRDGRAEGPPGAAWALCCLPLQRVPQVSWEDPGVGGAPAEPPTPLSPPQHYLLCLQLTGHGDDGGPGPATLPTAVRGTGHAALQAAG